MAEHRQPDPLLRALEAPLRGVYYPLGFRLGIETNDARVLDCAQSTYGVFPPGSLPYAPLRMRLLRVPHATATPPWPAAAYRASGDLLAIVCGPDNFLTADVARQHAIGFFSPAMLDDREFFRWTFLDCAVHMMLQRHHVTPVHAACVVRNGSAILLAAPAGSGKTSLAYHCVRHGWALLADDVSYISRERDDLLEVRGNPARLHFPVSARALFPELHSVPVGIRRDGDEFLAIPSAEWFPQQLVTHAEAVAVVFLDRRDEAGGISQLDPAAPAEAHSLLFGSTPLTDEPPVMAEFSAAIKRLVERAAYRLRYSSLDEARAQLEEICMARTIG